MRELHIGEGETVRVAVERRTVLLAVGPLAWRPLTRRLARDLARLLIQAADEAESTTNDVGPVGGAEAGEGEVRVQ